MFTIFKKDLADFFNSLVAYITIGTFLLVSGLFLWVFPESSILDYGYAGLDSLFNTVPFLFIFLIPAITMRSLAEEKKEGTFELLATQPLTDWQIVLGKALAAFAVAAIALLPTLIYYFSIYQLGITKGNIDTGSVIGSYIGLLLLAASFTSVGLFASSISNNQIIAFTIAVFLSFILYSGLDSISQLLSLQSIDTIITSFGINQHYQSISRGVLDSRDLIYFLSFIILFLLGTKTVLGGRRW